MAQGSASSAIRETLDGLLGPELRVRVVLRALSLAQTDVVPDAGPQLVDFVNRAVATALRELVDDEALARTAVERLWAVVRAAASGPPTAEVSLDPDPPAADWSDPTLQRGRATTQSLPRRRWPIVFFVSRDPERLQRFTAALSGQAQVESASDLFELTEGLDNTEGLLPIVVVDCPSLRLPFEQLKPMLPTLPARTTLVVWGTTKGVEGQKKLVQLFGTDAIGCSAEATPEDVAMLLMPFVG